MSEPILTLHLRMDDSGTTALEALNGSASIFSLEGTAEGALFQGSVEPGGISIRTVAENEAIHIAAHYVLAGKDDQGNKARVFVTNDGWIEKGYESLFKTTAQFMSDSPSFESRISGKMFVAHGRRVGSFVDLEVFEVENAASSAWELQGLEDIERFELVHFKKGEYIVKQGAVLDYVYFLSSGICRVSSLTRKGEEIVSDVRSARARSIKCLIGALSAFRPDRPHRTSFIAASDCYCYRMTSAEFKTFLVQHPLVLDAFLGWVMDRYAVLEDKFVFKQSQNVPGYVAAVLLENASQRGDELLVPSDMTNTSIARFAGANRVTVVRIMQALENEGAIARTEAGLVVKDVRKLQMYANGEATLKYKPSAGKAAASGKGAASGKDAASGKAAVSGE